MDLGSTQRHPIRIGVTIPQQHTTYAEMREAWIEAESLGVDTIFNWDHFFPLTGDPEGAHFESWVLQAAMAEVTERAQIGSLVTSISYRNPNLLADMARTVDHIADGRFILGLGAGWFERDYTEYGYAFKSGPELARDFRTGLNTVLDRLGKLNPAPIGGSLDLMIAGTGEKVMLKLVAQHANIWNGLGEPTELGRLNMVINDWCSKLGRDPDEIERSTLVLDSLDEDLLDAYLANGITHIIVGANGPGSGLDSVRQLVAWREARQLAMLS